MMTGIVATLDNPDMEMLTACAEFMTAGRSIASYCWTGKMENIPEDTAGER